MGKLAALAAMVIVAATGASVASAQDDDERMLRPPVEAEAIIYRDAGYQGPAVNVSSAKSNMGLNWRVNSIRVRSGTWQLCPSTNFRGSCITVRADNPMINARTRGVTVQSMRPVGASGGGLAPGDNRSLRGMAAEFFPAPARNGRRVLACVLGNGSANCAARTADAFCRIEGWNGSASERMQTVNGRNYLADVLCTRTGN